MCGMTKGRVAKFGVMVVLGVAAVGGVLMLLWNWLMPALFVGAHEIGFVQALGLLLLSKILFGGWRGHGGHGRHGGPGHWRHRFANLTPEERERFMAHGRGHCGHGHGKGWGRGNVSNDVPAAQAAEPTSNSTAPQAPERKV